MDQQTNSAQQPADATRPLDSKNWNELTVEERIDRLRMQVKYVHNILKDMEQMMNVIKSHTHNEDGKAVVKTNLDTFRSSLPVAIIKSEIDRGEQYI